MDDLLAKINDAYRYAKPLFLKCRPQLIDITNIYSASGLPDEDRNYHTAEKCIYPNRKLTGNTFNSHQGLICFNIGNQVFLGNDIPEVRAIIEKSCRPGNGPDQISGTPFSNNRLIPVKKSSTGKQEVDWEKNELCDKMYRYNQAQEIDARHKELEKDKIPSDPKKRMLLIVDSEMAQGLNEPKELYDAATKLQELLERARKDPTLYPGGIVFVYNNMGPQEQMDAMASAGAKEYLPTGREKFNAIADRNGKSNLPESFRPGPGETFFFKGGYSAVEGTKLLSHMQLNGIGCADVVGFHTSACVQDSVTDLRKNEVPVRVLSDCTYSKNAERTHAGLKVMANAGAEIMTSDQAHRAQTASLSKLDPRLVRSAIFVGRS